MKTLLKYVIVVLAGASIWSCNDDALTAVSVFPDSGKARTDFDEFLYREFTVPYNIDIKYWLDDREVDHTHQLLPANVESAKIMAVLLKHLWLDVYADASPEGVDFVRQYAIRIIQFVGSGAYNTDNSVTLGMAEGGKKITFNNLNPLSRYVYSYEGKKMGDPLPTPVLKKENLLVIEGNGYFHTIHHEFAHTLHQTKNFSEAFEQISLSNYLAESWTDWQINDDEKARSLGFITRYARNNKDEDFVEMYSTYVTITQEEWDARTSSGGPGAVKIFNEKLAIVREYFQQSWGLDIDVVRDIILRRADEINTLDYVNVK